MLYKETLPTKGLSPSTPQDRSHSGNPGGKITHNTVSSDFSRVTLCLLSGICQKPQAANAANFLKVNLDTDSWSQSRRKRGRWNTMTLKRNDSSLGRVSTMEVNTSALEGINSWSPRDNLLHKCPLLGLISQLPDIWRGRSVVTPPLPRPEQDALLWTQPSASQVKPCCFLLPKALWKVLCVRQHFTIPNASPTLCFTWHS